MDSMGWTSPEAYELFNLVVRRQADERRKQRERLPYVISVEMAQTLFGVASVSTWYLLALLQLPGICDE